MITVDSFYTTEKECSYKDERYLVRDNGAICRIPKEGRNIRPLDSIWTFGRPNKDGYLSYGGQLVHRIVATAFHGHAPSSKHVVDHIDTNRQNNRPENLRWLTPLENVLNNPITVARIISQCGSIEAFLDNPDRLDTSGTNLSWMRTVSPEEAKNALDNLLAMSGHLSAHREVYADWAARKMKPKGYVLPLPQRNELDKLWIFAETPAGVSENMRDFLIQLNLSTVFDSNHDDILQSGWPQSCSFGHVPDMPPSIENLVRYIDALEIGTPWLKQEYGVFVLEQKEWNSLIDAAALLSRLILEYEGESIVVMALTVVSVRNDKYVFENHFPYTDVNSAKKALSYFETLNDTNWILRPFSSNGLAERENVDATVQSAWNSVKSQLAGGKPRLIGIFNSADISTSDKDGKVTLNVYNEAQKLWLQENVLSSLKEKLEQLLPQHRFKVDIKIRS